MTSAQPSLVVNSAHKIGKPSRLSQYDVDKHQRDDRETGDHRIENTHKDYREEGLSFCTHGR